MNATTLTARIALLNANKATYVKMTSNPATPDDQYHMARTAIVEINTELREIDPLVMQANGEVVRLVNFVDPTNTDHRVMRAQEIARTLNEADLDDDERVTLTCELCAIYESFRD